MSNHQQSLNQPPQGYPQGYQPQHPQQPQYYQPQQQPQAYYQYAPQPYPAQAQAQAATASRGGKKWLYILPLGAALVLAGGAFLPWITFNGLGTSFSISGLGQFSGDTSLVGNSGGAKDGVITLSLAVVAILFALVGLFTARRWPAWLAFVAGLLASAISVIDLLDIQSRGKELSSDVATLSVGLGLYLSLGAALVLLVGSLLAGLIKAR